VQFAKEKGSSGATGEVAIKFYVERAAFETEFALYSSGGLREMMPAVISIEPNTNVRPSPACMRPRSIQDTGSGTDAVIRVWLQHRAQAPIERLCSSCKAHIG
jgi:hypothetical protein